MVYHQTSSKAAVRPVKQQHVPRYGLPTQQQLEALQRLQGPHGPRNGAQYSAARAGAHGLRGRGHGEQAAHAGAG